MFLYPFILAAVLAASPLPTPTPGLNEDGQRLNYALLTQGQIAKEAVIDGRSYTARVVQNILALYNDKGHMICATQVKGGQINFVLAHSPTDPFPQAQTVKQVLMDGALYTLKLDRSQGPLILAVYNEKGNIVHAVVDPSAVMVPSSEVKTSEPVDPFSI